MPQEKGVEIEVLDDEDEEPEYNPLPSDRYYWTGTIDEHRRNFILEHMASPDIDGRILVDNMMTVEHWLKTGELRELPKKK